MLTPHLTSLTARGHACFLASHLKFSYSTLYAAEIVYGHDFGPVLNCAFESHQGRFCMHTDEYTHTHTHTHIPLPEHLAMSGDIFGFTNEGRPGRLLNILPSIE